MIKIKINNNTDGEKEFNVCGKTQQNGKTIDVIGIVFADDKEAAKTQINRFTSNNCIKFTLTTLKLISE